MNNLLVPKLLTTIFFIGLLSCNTTKNVAGSYQTNFADLGFFMTEIELKSDSSFSYRFAGDLIDDKAKGKYRVINDTIFLIYDRNDSTPLRYSEKFMPSKKYHDKLTEFYYQEVLFIGNNKLYFANIETDKKVTKAMRYNKRRKYLFFGTHYYKKCWYLKKYPIVYLF
jgi:hypothetical protein